MKVHHQLTRGFWDDHHDQTASLSLSCKRLRPLAPKLSDAAAATTTTVAAFDLKSFIRPDSGPRKLAPTASNVSKNQPQVETHPGGTRWNPTQEQIGILEMLYCKGMRTPNAQQIDHITLQLSKYGKIEGKNVFYWFQNHKARERQKQKRTTLALSDHTTPPTPTTSFLSSPTSITLSFDYSKEESRRDEQVLNKRKSRSWAFEDLVFGDRSKSETEEEDEEDGAKKTLELFPLHPEGR